MPVTKLGVRNGYRLSTGALPVVLAIGICSLLVQVCSNLMVEKQEQHCAFEQLPSPWP